MLEVLYRFIGLAGPVAECRFPVAGEGVGSLFLEKFSVFAQGLFLLTHSLQPLRQKEARCHILGGQSHGAPQGVERGFFIARRREKVDAEQVSGQTYPDHPS